MEGRSPEELRELREKNEEQDRRIRKIADDMDVIRAGLEQNYRQMAKIETYLVGLDGNNGLRGELREYQKYTTMSMDAMRERVEKIGGEVLRTASGVIGAIGGVAGIIYAIIRIASNV